MLDSDLLYRFRLRLFALAEELGNVSAGLSHVRACTARPTTAGSRASRALGPRDAAPAGAPQPAHAQPDQPGHRATGPRLRHRPPGLGPRRISASLAQERWGGIVISHNGVWRILRRHGLSRRVSRLSLVAGYAARPEPGRPPEPERHIEVDHPGELVGFDCFHVGRLSGTKGKVWQYTAIDLATSYIWAELHTTPLNPSARNTSRLARRVAADLASGAGASSASSPTTAPSSAAPSSATRSRDVGAVQTRIHPGRPTIERLGRAGPAHDPRGVLATVLRALPRAQDRWPRAGPRALSRLLQHRARPHRTLHAGADPLADARRSEEDEAEMTTPMCRYISVAVHTRSSAPSPGTRRTDAHQSASLASPSIVAAGQGASMAFEADTGAALKECPTDLAAPAARVIRRAAGASGGATPSPRSVAAHSGPLLPYPSPAPSGW